MITLALALLLAQAPLEDAGTPDSGVLLLELYVKCPDAPLAEAVDGGYFFPTARLVRNNCKLAACESAITQAVAIKKEEHTEPGVILGTVAGGVAVIGLAVLFGYLLPHPAPR